MNPELVNKIADAMLYEGYMLYLYRASAVKNQQRFNFGVLMPESYSVVQKGSERSMTQTECLIKGAGDFEIDIKVRFLHLCEREVFEKRSDGFERVDSLDAGGERFQSWQEAIEREVEFLNVKFDDSKNASFRQFAFPHSQETTEIQGGNGEIAGKIVRIQEKITGKIEVSSTIVQTFETYSIFKITVRVFNTTPFESPSKKSRDEALAHSLASAHTVLTARNGEFVSLLEPDEGLDDAVRQCENIGTYPVLVGENGTERDCVWSSPIILYDYPEIAPESRGDLFDGAEIDEILTLRIMTMTDEEKREMLSVDEKVREILERTENLSGEDLMKMHGTLREPRAFENRRDRTKGAGG